MELSYARISKVGNLMFLILICYMHSKFVLLRFILPILFHSDMLPEAIIPPSDEHSYAQWLKEQDPENPQSESQGKCIVFIFMAHALLFFVSFVYLFFFLPQITDLQNVNSQSFSDERQCSLCQQHGDAKPNVGEALTNSKFRDESHVWLS